MAYDTREDEKNADDDDDDDNVGSNHVGEWLTSCQSLAVSFTMSSSTSMKLV